MFGLTRRERLLVALVLLLFLLGWSYQTWRTYSANSRSLPTTTQHE